MFPREHGAYGQLLFPLIAALSIGRPGATAFALVLAAVAAFLAHEPMLVLFGQRGGRAARDQRSDAFRWLIAFAGPAVMAGAWAVTSSDVTVRTALVVPAIGAIALGGCVARGIEHTVPGEMLSAVTLSSIAWPVALASGARPIAAATCAAVFGAGFVAATACVHAVIARTRRPPAIGTRVRSVATAAILVSVVASAARRGMLAPIGQWAVLPLAAAGAILAVVARSSRYLRVVGWTLVAATALTTVVVVGSLR